MTAFTWYGNQIVLSDLHDADAVPAQRLGIHHNYRVAGLPTNPIQHNKD